MASGFVCIELEDAAVNPSYREDPLPEDDGGVELECLLHHVLHQFLSENLSKTRDIVDVLLGVQDGNLPTHLLKGVDELHLHLSQTGIESGKETGWSCAYYRDVICIQGGVEFAANF